MSKYMGKIMNKNNTYQGGAENFKGVIRLSSNENNNGIPAKVKKIISQNAKFSHIYPELNSQSLIKKIADYNKIKEQNIIIGAGSDEVLQMIFNAFTKPGDYVMYSKYSFAMYRVFANNFKCKSLVFNDKNFKFKLEDFKKKYNSKVKLIFLANPNNPTGSIFLKKELVNFIKSINEKTILVLDSAYSEYLLNADYTDGIHLVNKFKNIIVTKTFSKIFGLGGLRVGWGYAQNQLIQKLYQVKKPFNVSRIASAAAYNILNKNWVKKQALLNISNKSYILSRLNNYNIEIIDTDANFVLLKLGSEKKSKMLNNFAIKNKITVRSLKSYGLPNFIRMSVGTKKEIKRVVEVLNNFNV